MTEIQKVVKGLAACMPQTDEDAAIGCDGCPYNGNPCSGDYQDNDHVNLPVRMIDDVRALLKAQEPRVIPRDAIQASTGAPVWFESRNGRVYTGWALAYDIQRGQGITGERLGVTQPSGRVMWVKLDDYGRTWRMWDKCPTGERREAEPWRD